VRTSAKNRLLDRIFGKKSPGVLTHLSFKAKFSGKKEIMGGTMTLDEALRWMTTLKARHAELVSLRNENSKDKSRYFGDREVAVEKPVYDVKALDKLVNNVAKEVRRLDEAIKKTNTLTQVVGYEKSEEALGEIA
jgi:hypothetical protein